MSERKLPVPDLEEALGFFTGRLGFRLERIFPADAPRVAVVSREELVLALHEGPPEDAQLPAGLPPLAPSFELVRFDEHEGWVAGRAGMQYRDLIPGRQGGRVIASHIRIPEGGSVPDSVHFHDIRFQLIYCRRGWVRVVYEDQGEPFLLEEGDCVLQPPRIRHRVLESSPGLEVVEIASPAEHLTSLDHELGLPTGREDPERDFGGQRFLRHGAKAATWTGSDWAGFDERRLGLDRATGGLATGRVLRAGEGAAELEHGGELCFGFLLEGAGDLRLEDRTEPLGPGDAFSLPAGIAASWRPGSAAARLLLIELR